MPQKYKHPCYNTGDAIEFWYYLENLLTVYLDGKFSQIHALIWSFAIVPQWRLHTMVNDEYVKELYLKACDEVDIKRWCLSDVRATGIFNFEAAFSSISVDDLYELCEEHTKNELITILDKYKQLKGKNKRSLVNDAFTDYEVENLWDYLLIVDDRDRIVIEYVTFADTVIDVDE